MILAFIVDFYDRSGMGMARVTLTGAGTGTVVCFLGFKDSWSQSFAVSKFLGFKVSKIQ